MPEAARRWRFFLWSDMHIRAPQLEGQYPSYPLANEKAAWALACAQGREGLEPPDAVLSAGDIINGEIPDFAPDFDYFKTLILDPLAMPFLPCLGNHENQQGEGLPAQNVAYNRYFGPRWHNYAFTVAGFAFIVVDTSGAHRLPDAVTAARNAFVERALAWVGPQPTLVVTHVPLIALRDEAPLKASFGFSSWKVLDPGLLSRVEAHADTVIAVLGGHLHLSATQAQQGIYHIACAGTCGYPADFAAFDLYEDRIEVQKYRAPAALLDRGGNIHGRPRHAVDYTDAAHPDPELYLWGNSEECRFTIPLDGAKRPASGAPAPLRVFHEFAPGRWEEALAGF